MARSDVEPASGQNPQRPMGQPQEDLGDLTAVLADIMPILDRIQSRSPQAGAPGLFGHASVDTFAAVALVSDLGADSLRRLTAYLDAHAQNFSGLETCAPVVAAAARALAARDYAQAFTLLFRSLPHHHPAAAGGQQAAGAGGRCSNAMRAGPGARKTRARHHIDSAHKLT